mmetsp:Transcript_22569/g.39374  ORF Transcript_22569/g.39374 Transcript_22569/m.39374 type:complete len:82 (+) Transcript_22569:304-549(+)
MNLSSKQKQTKKRSTLSIWTRLVAACCTWQSKSNNLFCVFGKFGIDPLVKVETDCIMLLDRLVDVDLEQAVGTQRLFDVPS